MQAERFSRLQRLQTSGPKIRYHPRYNVMSTACRMEVVCHQLCLIPQTLTIFSSLRFWGVSVVFVVFNRVPLFLFDESQSLVRL